MGRKNRRGRKKREMREKKEEGLHWNKLDVVCITGTLFSCLVRGVLRFYKENKNNSTLLESRGWEFHRIFRVT
jgi:hypothetical protein